MFKTVKTIYYTLLHALAIVLVYMLANNVTINIPDTTHDAEVSRARAVLAQDIFEPAYKEARKK